MIARAVHGLARWYLGRPVLVEAGGAARWLASTRDATVVTSKSAARAVNGARPGTVDTGQAIVDPSIEVTALDALVPAARGNWIVALGGGRVMDAAKYLAWKAGKRLCAIPTVLSTTSWLNMAIAVRDNNRLVFPGTIHARRIVVDPPLVASSPAALTLGGVADILCACSALGDWEIAASATGEKVPQDAVDRFAAFVHGILDSPGKLVPFDAAAVARVVDIFLDGLAWCGATFSGRPLEGAEHFLYYCIDEMDGRTFVHGRMIALTTLIALHAQGDRARFDPAVVRAFFDRVGIPVSLAANGLSRADIDAALDRIGSFVRDRGLPRCTWDGEWDRHAVGEFLATAP